MLLEPARIQERRAGSPRSAGRSRRRPVLSRAQSHHAVGAQTTSAHGGARQPQRAIHRADDRHDRAVHRRSRDHPAEGVPARDRNSRAMPTVPRVGGKGGVPADRLPQYVRLILAHSASVHQDSEPLRVSARLTPKDVESVDRTVGLNLRPATTIDVDALTPEQPTVSAGTSRQATPVHSTNRTPASAVRSGTRNRPGCRRRRLGAGGSNGATRSHRSSGTRSARTGTPRRPRSASTRPTAPHLASSARSGSVRQIGAQPEAPSSGRWSRKYCESNHSSFTKSGRVRSAAPTCCERKRIPRSVRESDSSGV